MDPPSLPQLIPLLQTLLSSPSPLTLGASLTAFFEICPDRMDLLHPYFRHICHSLADADEWGQVVALDVLTRYARTMLEKPGTAGPMTPPADSRPDVEDDDEFEGIDVDLALLLYSVRPLFLSRNPAVVVGAAMAFWNLAPAGHPTIGQQLLVRPLLRLAGGTDCTKAIGEDIASYTWSIIADMTAERPVSLGAVRG